MPAILIVEDDRHRALTLKKYLQTNSVEVLLAEDGLEAMTILRTEKPDLILSDANMPGMDGFALARNVKSNETIKRLPFFLYSSKRLPDDNTSLAYRWGVNRCIMNEDIEEIGYEALAYLKAM